MRQDRSTCSAAMPGCEMMSAGTAYQEQDIYAEQVSRILCEQGLILEEEEAQMRRLLRGW